MSHVKKNNVEKGKARAAAAWSSPEDQVLLPHIRDVAREHVEKFMSHGVHGPPSAKGTQRTEILNDIQFQQVKETGTWEGDVPAANGGLMKEARRRAGLD